MARTIGFLGPLGTYSEEAALLYDATADRQLTPTEALAPANEVIEVTTTVGASLHYARLRAPADYQEI